MPKQKPTVTVTKPGQKSAAQIAADIEEFRTACWRIDFIIDRDWKVEGDVAVAYCGHSNRLSCDTKSQLTETYTKKGWQIEISDHYDVNVGWCDQVVVR